MKRALLILAVVCAFELSAQETQTIDAGYSRVILSEFTAIDVDAPITLTLIRIADDATPYIEYNTQGVFDSRFTATVNKSNTLRISERVDSKRESVTDVRLYYKRLDNISIAKATTTAEGVITTRMLDLKIAEGGIFIATIDVLDILAMISGSSRVMLSGKALYQSANITSSEYNASELETTSTIINSTHNAVSSIYAHERIEAKTSTGGKVLYKSEPQIFRSEITLFGGEISLM